MIFPARQQPNQRSRTLSPTSSRKDRAMATIAPAAPTLGINLYDESLSYVHGASDVPLIGATIGDMFDRIVEQLPEHEALVSRHQRIRWTYRELQEQCD